SVSRWRNVEFGRTAALFAAGAILLALVVVPLLFLFYGSVFTGAPGQAGSLSLEKYAEVLSDPRSYRLLAASFIYAAGSALISFTIGGTIAWLVQRTDLPA